MEVSQPPFGRQGLRTLAAIVFTDIVAFSARMQRDEVKTLALVNRDFAEMRRMCEARGGAVLKTTGDGLLCYFASAVEAVACALEMQRHFAGLEKKIAPDDVLQHRVGIHLGDVMVQDQDVMGDGVNIAARLQAEAEPGGICISQTVYDVVKNKIELQATYLGARELKNIAHAVPIYHILIEAQALGATASPAAAVKKSQRLAVPILVSAVVILLAAGAALSLRKKNPPAAPVQVPVSTLAPAHPPAAETAKAESPNPAHPTAASAPAEHETKALAARHEFMQEIREPYLLRYDYDGLLQAIQAGKVKVDMANPAQVRRSIEHMSEMKSWFLERLSHFTPAQPLTVPRFGSGGESDYKIYGAPSGKIAVISDGVPAASALSDLKPAFLSLVLLAAIRNDPGLPSDVLLGASAFARFYNLPEMENELRPIGNGSKRTAKP
ncbi:MAG TPA: adenylate/guanylate cyclase domain-containing protein [Opitutaceae bacterium]|jgi:class 3 adenylate cyclase|nr:adenylate/guanylate cyclase domain-containing protein [Opitutaceae bacterium]